MDRVMTGQCENSVAYPSPTFLDLSLNGLSGQLAGVRLEVLVNGWSTSFSRDDGTVGFIWRCQVLE